MTSRYAMSLMEVVISIVIFATLLVAVLETALSVRRFTDQHENLLDLEQEGRQILDQLTGDLSNTTWMRTGLTYPKVVADDFGTTIEFLRIRGVSPGSTDSGIARFDFSAPAARMQEWKEPLKLSAVPGLVVNESFRTNGPTNLAGPAWETAGTKGETVVDRNRPLSFSDNNKIENLRIYVYRVELCASGRGTLRRFYREGVANGPLIRDSELNDLGRNIYSLTARLTGQRIIVSLELRRNQPGAPAVPVPGVVPPPPQVSRFETVIAMRSIN